MLHPPREEVDTDTPALAADDNVPEVPAMSGEKGEIIFCIHYYLWRTSVSGFNPWVYGLNKTANQPIR